MRAEVAVSIPVAITAFFATLSLILAGVALYHDIYWQRAVEDSPHFQEMLTWMEENEAHKDLSEFYRDLFYQVVVVAFFIAPTVLHLIPYLVLTVKSRSDYEDSDDDELETPDEDPDYLLLPTAEAPENSGVGGTPVEDSGPSDMSLLAHHHHYRERPSLLSKYAATNKKDTGASPINKSRFGIAKSWTELRHSYERSSRDNGVSSAPVLTTKNSAWGAGSPKLPTGTGSSDAAAAAASSKPRTKWQRSVNKITEDLSTIKKSMHRPFLPSKPARSVGFKMVDPAATQKMNELHERYGIKPSTISAPVKHLFPSKKLHYQHPRRLTHAPPEVNNKEAQQKTMTKRAKRAKGALQDSTAAQQVQSRTSNAGMLAEPVTSDTALQDDLSLEQFEEDRLPFLNERVMKLLLFTVTIFESMTALCACYYQLKYCNEFQDFYTSFNVTQRLHSLNAQMKISALMLTSCSLDLNYLNRLTAEHPPFVKVRDDLHVCQDYQAKQWSSILCALYAITGAISTFTIYWQYRVTLSFVDGDTSSWRSGRNKQNKAEAPKVKHSLVTVVDRDAGDDDEVFMDPALVLKLTMRKESFSEDEKLFSPFSQFQGLDDNVKTREREYNI